MNLIQTPSWLSDNICKLFLSKEYFVRLPLHHQSKLLSFITREWLRRGKANDFEVSLKTLLNWVSSLFTDRSGFLPLHFAVVGGILELIQLCLDKRPPCPETMKSVSNFAITNGAPKFAIEYLFERNPETILNLPGSLLVKAMNAGRLDILELLLDKANPDDLAMLHVAAQSGCDDLIEELSKNLNSLDDIVDKHQRTALHLAASESDRDMMRLLVKLGCSISSQDAQGRTVLHHAVLPVCEIDFCQPESEIKAVKRCVRWLIRQGVDKGARDVFGETPYDYVKEELIDWRILKPSPQSRRSECLSSKKTRAVTSSITNS